MLFQNISLCICSCCCCCCCFPVRGGAAGSERRAGSEGSGSEGTGSEQADLPAGRRQLESKKHSTSLTCETQHLVVTGFFSFLSCAGLPQRAAVDDLPEGVARQRNKDPAAAWLPGPVHPDQRARHPQEHHHGAAARDRWRFSPSLLLLKAGRMCLKVPLDVSASHMGSVLR